MAIGAAVGTAAGAGLAVATPTVILPILGFGAAGIGKATIAAYIHSAIGIVAKGSWFAATQSAGAVGAISSATTSIISAAGTAGGVVVGGAGSMISWLRGKVSHKIWIDHEARGNKLCCPLLYNIETRVGSPKTPGKALKSKLAPKVT